MTALGVLNIVDGAPIFVDFVPDPIAIGEAVRKFGRSELDAAIAIVRSAEGDKRRLMLQASGQRLGQLVGAGALNEEFARAMLEEAALACGLIRDDGARAVKKAVSDALKLGKKQPRDISEVRGDAIAALRALHDQRRPREAPDQVMSPPIGTDDSVEPSTSSSVFVSSSSPRSPSGKKEADETLAKADENGDDDEPPLEIISDDTFEAAQNSINPTSTTESA